MNVGEIIDLEMEYETVEEIDEEIKNFRNEYKKILNGHVKLSISYHCGRFMTEIFNTFSSILSEINVPRTVFDVHSIAQSLMKSKEFDKLRADFFEGLHFIASHDLWDKRTEFITEMDGTDEEFQEIEEKMMKTLQWGERETMSHLEMAIEVSIFQKTPLKFLNSYNFPYKITLEDSEYTS